MRTIKVTLDVYLDAEYDDDEELRAAEGYTVAVVKDAAREGIVDELGTPLVVAVEATGYAIVEKPAAEDDEFLRRPDGSIYGRRTR